MNALTQPVPRAKRRRRSSGEDTQGAFRMSAAAIIRWMKQLKPSPAIRRHISPEPELPEAATPAVPFLFDTLDWFNPWHYEEDGELHDDYHRVEPNHLSLHL